MTGFAGAVLYVTLGLVGGMLVGVGPVRLLHMFWFHDLAHELGRRSKRRRINLSEHNSNERVKKDIRLELRSCPTNTFYRMVTCHSTPEIFQSLLGDFNEALKRAVRVQIITAKQVFGAKVGDRWTHPLEKLLKSYPNNFEWRVMDPPIIPHMRLTKNQVVIEHPHGFDDNRNYDHHYGDAEVVLAKQRFEVLWERAVPVRTIPADVVILNSEQQEQIKARFREMYKAASKELCNRLSTQ